MDFNTHWVRKRGGGGGVRKNWKENGGEIKQGERALGSNLINTFTPLKHYHQAILKIPIYLLC